MAMSKIKQQPGRLALREEGGFWNAYYAVPNTMQDAILLGSIRMRFVEDPRRKQEFMDLMMEAVSDIFEEATGAQLEWPEPEGRPAPERERGGNA
jgi:hypothetical protein